MLNQSYLQCLAAGEPLPRGRRLAWHAGGHGTGEQQDRGYRRELPGSAGLGPHGLLPLCLPGCSTPTPEAGWFKDIRSVLPFPLPFGLALTRVFVR